MANKSASSTELVDSIKRIETVLNQVLEDLSGVKQRLLTLERRYKIRATPKREVPVFIDHDDRLSEYQYQTLTPALQQIYDIVDELTQNPGQWVALEDIISRSSRSRPTVSAQVKDLYRANRLERKSKLIETPKGRRVRKFLYRTRK